MNHSDVPKGTTVLGVDIGGGTKEQAVAKLDAALGKRAKTPLQLSVDGKNDAAGPGQGRSLAWTARRPCAAPRAATTTRCR